ncbi:DUF4181 domain-containing protein [Planococcus sp. CAU13]|uniref:DUF4181 domain-containing protein n=1 Tax=Planococcus sp. CAU13 TaxID=1541197 RepID=UPI0005300AF1|nr:DUF4181 domain-containing protein [Planococcus sp. CAU13]
MFWLKLAIIFFVLFLLISGLNFFLRKVFKIEKEKKSIFSYNHINDLHKKVDRFVRIGFMLLSIIIMYLVIFKEFPVTLYLILLIFLTMADYLVRAIFEWKYSQNPKQAILTISEMSLFVIALIIIFHFDLLNFFTT